MLGFKYVWNVMIGIVVVVVRQMEMVGRQKYTCEINSVFKKNTKKNLILFIFKFYWSIVYLQCVKFICCISAILTGVCFSDGTMQEMQKQEMQEIPL